MTAFIKVTYKNLTKGIVAIDSISFIDDSDGYAIIHMKDGSLLHLRECVYEIEEKIKAIQQQTLPTK